MKRLLLALLGVFLMSSHAMALEPENTLHLQLKDGLVVIELRPDLAPKHVARIKELARQGFYDGIVFHRVIEGFMIQGGDPEGTGAGGPGYTFGDEFKSGHAFDKVGLLAMANRGPATNGSQFFITTSTPDHLNGKHTIFGEVLAGYDVVEKISKIRKEKVVMTRVTISEKSPVAAPAKAGAK
jgi:peptidyl-prolyl cis-trans isomerase A (cyclophilin A)